MPSEVQQLNDEAGSYQIDEIEECSIQVFDSPILTLNLVAVRCDWSNYFGHVSIQPLFERKLRLLLKRD